MGKGARWIARCSTSVALVGAVAAGMSGTAFGYGAGGVNVPDSTFRQGTGNREIVVAITRPAVGTGEQLVVWPYYSQDYHWLVGVTADPGTGATCAYDVGQWQCTPGRDGWRPGNLRILVNTTEGMNCGLHAGVCQNDAITVQSLPAARDRSGLADGQPVTALGNVLIMPASVPWHGPTAPADPPVAAPPAAASAPGAVPAVDAGRTPAGEQAGFPLGLSALVLGAVVLGAVVLGAGVPIGFRVRRRRHAGGG